MTEPFAAADDRTLDGPHGPFGVRVYAPAEPARVGLVWAHGGGFAGGDLDMPEADWVARQLADRGIAVVSVDYALAPVPAGWTMPPAGNTRERLRYPVASEEVGFAFTWAVGSGLVAGPWALGGASAGANLATGAALRLVHKGGPVPALVALAYPTLHAVQDAPDADLRALLDADPDADRFGPDVVRRMYENYLGGSLDAADVYAVPGAATAAQLAGFPSVLMINGEADELRMSGEAFARSLSAAGVPIEAVTERGTQHGHLNRPDEAAASASIKRIAARLSALSPATEGTPS
ncbi:alpha/beta hydrolase [Microbacterium sp. zg-YB36]|uniref:alpha/beta hydrolase n=1 Tax=Microbacterium sp. zg-YB36 TaxID=2969407 RepID=UPI00214B95D4|nr:alpha/beta hydrolase [Microbacterium sp. zg-YB36]MDL5351782.1 alpha/beta hydrolase [Microbacterium sp. zg-YB36]